VSTSLNAEWELAEPRADAMIESLRSFGYSPETAIADLIDNSISANSKLISINFIWRGADSVVTIADDGVGMDERQLLAAMRPGSMSPLESRGKRDLGRFGLGLKTASFSQARELTVVTRAQSRLGESVRRWDLDTVAKTRQWRLLKTEPPTVEGIAPELGARGTVVLWSKCDRLVGSVHTDDEKAQNRFLKVTNDVALHISATFGKFLSGRGKIRITVNGRDIKPWDPFLESHPSTSSAGEELLPLGGKMVRIKPFILPHRSKLSQAETEQGAGRHGWNQQQGFYVYRNNRLLLGGDWLGLGYSKDEHAKLARISIEFPSELDHYWQIDVKKSTARPPGVMVDDLKRIATATRRRAEDVYRHRGKIIAQRSSQSFVSAWNPYKRRDGSRGYRVNRENPLVRAVFEESGANGRSVEKLLRFVEETVPTTMIGIGIADSIDKQHAPFDESKKEFGRMLRFLYHRMVENGSTPETVIEVLSATEPFAGYPEMISDLKDELA